MSQSWDQRRSGLAQVHAYYKACLEIIEDAQNHAEAEDEDMLREALYALSELEGPPDGCVELEAEEDIVEAAPPKQGYLN